MRFLHFIAIAAALCVASPASALVLLDENGKQYVDMPTCKKKDPNFEKCMAKRQKIIDKYHTPGGGNSAIRGPHDPPLWGGSGPFEWHKHQHDWKNYF